MTDHELEMAGLEIAALLIGGDFHKIAAKYSYALSFGLQHSLAIQRDFSVAVQECHGSINNNNVSVSVSHFPKSSMGIKSLVECDIPFEFSTGVWVELIESDEGMLYLEQISSYRGSADA